MNEQLRQAMETDRLPHACVLEGGTSESRLALARTLAKALVCKDGAHRPCGKCDACKKAESGNHPDIRLIGPDPGRKSLSVDVIRDMRDDAYILPNEADKKVYIIDPADSMLDYAQNALLKILEEPPVYATFLMLCTSKASLLPTVLSRTAVFSMTPVVGADQSGEQVKEAKQLAEGIGNAVASGSEQQLLAAVAPFEKKYDLLPLALEQLGLIFRDALVILAGGTQPISGAPNCVGALSGHCTEQELLSMVEAVEDISTAITLHANKNLTLSRLVSRLAEEQ